MSKTVECKDCKHQNETKNDCSICFWDYEFYNAGFTKSKTHNYSYFDKKEKG